MRRPLSVALVVLVAYLLFDFKVLSSHDWNPRAFIMERRQEIPREQGWDIGYDAQYYYAIAVDPLSAADKLDSPTYRYQRIIYPLFIRIISLGNENLMPWTMLVINLAAVSAIAGILAGLLSRRGVSVWFAVVLVFFLGLMLSMRMDLLEPLVLALGLGGWMAYKKDKPAVGILLFALSGLTKEVGLIFPAAITAWLLLQGKWRTALWTLAGSTLPFLVWQFYLTSQFGTRFAASGATHLTRIPFSGLFNYKDLPGFLFVGFWAAIPAVLGGLGLAWDLWRRPSSLQHPEIFLLIFQVALIATLPRPTWGDPLAVLRTATGLLVSLLLWLALSHPRALPYLAAFYIPSGLVMAIVPGLL